MGFDASKLIVGKKYPARAGAAEFVRAFRWSTVGEDVLIWITCIGDVYGQSYTTNKLGQQMTVTHEASSLDIISDEPIKEPVEVTVERRFLNVYEDWSICAHASIQSADENASTRRIGIYELPEKILVTPR